MAKYLSILLLLEISLYKRQDCPKLCMKLNLASLKNMNQISNLSALGFDSNLVPSAVPATRNGITARGRLLCSGNGVENRPYSPPHPPSPPPSHFGSFRGVAAPSKDLFLSFPGIEVFA
jgi:hypothetical protein